MPMLQQESGGCLPPCSHDQFGLVYGRLRVPTCCFLSCPPQCSEPRVPSSLALHCRDFGPLVAVVPRMLSCPHCQMPPFLHSWGAFLLSTVMWMQPVVLSWYPLHAVRTSMHAAVHRLLAKTPRDVPHTLVWVSFLRGAYCGPLQTRRRTSQDGSGGRLIGGWYTPWHLRHQGACSNFCADWSFDPPLFLCVSCLLFGASTWGGGLKCLMMHDSTRILFIGLRCSGTALHFLCLPLLQRKVPMTCL